MGSQDAESGLPRLEMRPEYQTQGYKEEVPSLEMESLLLEMTSYIPQISHVQAATHGLATPPQMDANAETPESYPSPLENTSSPGTEQSENSLQCKWKDCTRTYTDSEDLYKHLCDAHVGRKATNNLSLTCHWSDCKVTTNKRDHITSHIRIHVPLKPYKCDTCTKQFKRPQDLKKHQKIHVDTRSQSVTQGYEYTSAPRGAPAGIGSASTASGYYHYPQNEESRKRALDQSLGFFEDVKRSKIQPAYSEALAHRLSAMSPLIFSPPPSEYDLARYTPLRRQDLVENESYFDNLCANLELNIQNRATELYGYTPQQPMPMHPQYRGQHQPHQHHQMMPPAQMQPQSQYQPQYMPPQPSHQQANSAPYYYPQISSQQKHTSMYPKLQSDSTLNQLSAPLEMGNLKRVAVGFQHTSETDSAVNQEKEADFQEMKNALRIAKSLKSIVHTLLERQPETKEAEQQDKIEYPSLD